MKIGYLVLASERRLLTIVLEDDLGSVQQAIGCQAIEHATTFSTEDQLLIDADGMDHSREDTFTVVGDPFAFLGNALLVGTDQITGDIADQPVMSLDELTRL